jgi:hypothetical protein
MDALNYGVRQKPTAFHDNTSLPKRIPAFAPSFLPVAGFTKSHYKECAEQNFCGTRL